MISKSRIEDCLRFLEVLDVRRTSRHIEIKADLPQLNPVHAVKDLEIIVRTVLKDRLENKGHTISVDNLVSELNKGENKQHFDAAKKEFSEYKKSTEALAAFDAMCFDEGCPNHGIDHVCVSPSPYVVKKRKHDTTEGSAAAYVVDTRKSITLSELDGEVFYEAICETQTIGQAAKIALALNKTERSHVCVSPNPGADIDVGSIEGPDVPQWQPIDTAPKGVAVLVKTTVNSTPLVARIEADNTWRPCCFSSVELFPVEWMPLPAAPKLTGE